MTGNIESWLVDDETLDPTQNHLAPEAAWDRLPLFPELSATESLNYDALSRPFTDEFLSTLAASMPLQRLKGIGFLGALDYIAYGNGNRAHQRRHNRYDHSIGVAKLAERFAFARALPERERRTLVAAGLLHDVGHGPLSHTLEPVFKAAFGLTHHLAGRNIIIGRSPLGDEIPTIFRTFGLDLDEVIAMIEGEHHAPHAFLFSSPINLDTIEGITRTSLFGNIRGRHVQADRLVDLIAVGDALPTRQLDAFWTLKHNVYNLFIHTQPAMLFDGLAQAYMSREIEHFASRDFLKTEPQLRYKHPALFYLFAWTRNSKSLVQARVSRMFADLLDYQLDFPIRSFSIVKDVALNKTGDLWQRYRQSKVTQQRSIGDLFD